MAYARRSKTTPDLPERTYEVDLGPRRKLRAGMVAKVRLPGRGHNVTARFLYADEQGLAFADPRNNGRRTVTPDAVKSIPRKQPEPR